MADLMVRLRVLRAEKNVSQETTAKCAGISFRAYNNIENGRAVPSMPSLVALADYFDVSLDYLLGRTDKRER